MKAEQVLELVEDINNSICEASDIKPGDAVILNTKELAGVKAAVVNIHPERRTADVEIGKGGIRTEIPFGEMKKVPSHGSFLTDNK